MQLTKLLTVSIALGSASVLPGCGVGEASVPEAADVADATPVPVETVFAERGAIVATYEAAATLESDEDAPVTAKAAGDVVEILVEEGDIVTAGTVLARLDGERLRLTMVSAKAELDRVQSEFNRLRDLHERKLVSAAMYEGLRYDLDALEASYKLAKLNYSYSAVRAPIDGIVTTRDIKLGQNVAVGDVTFRITNRERLEAELKIPQTELAKFGVGHTATLHVDSMPGTLFEAEIARISPTIDTQTGTFRATAIIDNADGYLAPGMFARFTIAYEKHDDVLIVPSEAIVVEDDLTTVYVVSDGAVDKRAVRTGISADGRIEVLSGLKDRDEIVVVGQASLREGSKVLAQAATDSFIG